MADNTINDKQKNIVPDIVISRLPIYLRSLSILKNEGKIVTSSQELGTRLGLSSAQIRKDLSHFGEFGKQGTGYNIDYLREQLKIILNLDKLWPVALVGVGDLGHALAHYGRFAEKGFKIAALFDSDPKKIGTILNGVAVEDVQNIVTSIKTADIRIAILSVPMKVAHNVSEKLVEAGIRAILNYAPITLSVPEGVKVQNIDPIAHLQKMTYYCERR